LEHDSDSLEAASPLNPALEEPISGTCCKCCKSRQCCETCKCCEACRCCKTCGNCRCCRPAPHPNVTWGHWVRHVVNENVILGCFVQFKPMPTLIARWLLLLLFLTTAVFVQYADQAMGPICVREYLAQSPPFEMVAKYSLPWQYLKLAPPAVIVPDDVATKSRRLDSYRNHSGFAYRRLHDSTGHIRPQKSGGASFEKARESLIEQVFKLLGSDWRFDCSKPMCDLFYPQMIDSTALWVNTNKWFGSNNAVSPVITSDAVIIGYCKCDGPIYNGVHRAKATGEARSIVLTVLLQTLLPGFFKTAFEISGDRAGGSRCSKGRARCGYFSAFLLLAFVAIMGMGIFLVKFDPAGWRTAFIISAVNAATIDPLKSVMQIALCERVGWPLRFCGCGPSIEPLSRRPLPCSFKLIGSHNSGQPSSESMDSIDPKPACLGRAST